MYNVSSEHVLEIFAGGHSLISGSDRGGRLLKGLKKKKTFIVLPLVVPYVRSDKKKEAV